MTTNYPAIRDWHCEVERVIRPGEPAYEGYSGTDGRPVYLVACRPPWVADGFVRHVPICADDEADAIRQTVPVFQSIPMGEWR